MREAVKESELAAMTKTRITVRYFIANMAPHASVLGSEALRLLRLETKLRERMGRKD